MEIYTLGRTHTTDFSRCDFRASQTKHTDVCNVFNCKWAVTRWQWLYCMYMNMKWGSKKFNSPNLSDALPNHSATHIYCGSRLWFLLQTQRCFLWSTNWLSYRLASLQSVNVTRTSSIIITPWYQTGSNNTNKTHCWGFRLFRFLEIL